MQKIATQSLNYISGGVGCPESIAIYAASGAALPIVWGFFCCLWTSVPGCALMAALSILLGGTLAFTGASICYDYV